MNGAQEIAQLRQGGFSEDELQAHEAQQRRTLSNAGFSEEEVNAHFGVKALDMGGVQKHFDNTAKKLRDESVAEDGTRKAVSVKDYFEAGFQMSVTGLDARRKLPDVALGEDAPWFGRAIASAATVGGDLPAMVVGALYGGAAGGAIGTAIAPGPGTVVGGVVGAGGGAFALPSALREDLIRQIRDGRVKDARDFLDRSLAIAKEGAKGFVVGGLTAGTGAGVKLAQPLAQPALNGLLQLGAEVTALTTASSALEGRVPQPQDFADAAIMLGGLKAALSVGRVPTAVAEKKFTRNMRGHVEAKMQDIYAQTGKLPAEVLADAQRDPAIREDLLSVTKDIPDAYRPFVEKAALERTPEEVQVLSRVASKEVVKGVNVRALGHQLYTDLKNDLHPINRVTKALADGEKLEVADNPAQLAQLMRGAFAKADHFLEFRPFEFNTLKNVGKSLKDIFEPHKADLDGWRAYAVAKRAIELEGRGIKTGVPVSEARAVAKAGQGKYGKSFKEVQEYQRHLLNYLRDSGILSEKAFDSMLEANKDFVPFHRLMEEKEGGKGVGGGMRVKQPIKKIKGSERVIVDPLESIIKNTYSYIELAERNRVGVALVELAEKSPIGSELLRPVKQKNKPTTVTSQEMQKFLEANGVEIPEAGLDTLTVFRPGGFVTKANEISVFRNGKREVFEVDPELGRAFNALDRQSVSMLLKALSVPASLLRAGSVLSPEFMARNLIRDQLHAFILSEGGFVPFLDALRGITGLMKKNETFQAWLKSGGPNAALVNIDRQYIAQNVFKLDKQTNFIGKTLNIAKSPIEFLRISSELIENSTRLGEFNKVTKGKRDIGTLLRGGLASREVTLDFARIGAKARGVNLVTAFWNAHVEGLDRVVRGLRDNPGRTTAKAIAGITVPSVLLWWANHDDPRWKVIPQWQKDLFWIVMTDNNIYRIPKPFEMGLVFGSVPERMLEQFFTDNPRALDDLSETIIEQIAPDLIPTFAVPPVEQFSNRSTFTGNPIIPGYLEGLLPEYQYTQYTTEVTKALGSIIGTIPGLKERQAASPVILDNYLRGWTGGLGNYALRLADFALRKVGALPDPVKPSDTLADIPFVKAFSVRFPSGNAEPIRDFYDRYERNATVLRTIRSLAQDGDAEAVRREYELAPDAVLRLDDIRDALGQASKFVRMIHKNPAMGPDEKRQLIDAAYYQMIEMATQGNTLMDEAEKAFASDGAK